MWNPGRFYFDLAGVCASYHPLENLHHFLGRQIDAARRCDQCIVDRERAEAIIVRGFGPAVPTTRSPCPAAAS
jgi:hypothetical protein